MTRADAHLINPHSPLLCCTQQTLREPQSRALYDHELSQAELRATVVLHDEIDLQDMDCADTNSNCSCGDQHEAQEHGENLGAGTEQAGGNMSSQLQQYTYPCRCGDSYVLAAPDMQLAAHTRQIIIPCRCGRRQGQQLGE